VKACNGTPVASLAELKALLVTRSGPIQPVALEVRRLGPGEPLRYEDLRLVVQPVIR
jgi:hypothetical protein